LIIGLTGKNGSGKGEVVNMLKGLNFDFYSLSDVLRDELKNNNQEITRENLIQTGNDLRKKYGPGVLADKVMQALQVDKNYVIDSIRNPAEVQSLRRNKNFTLINIDASPEIRFERIKTRSRESDPTTFNDFLELEKKEAAGDVHSQNLNETTSLADIVLENNTSLDVLRDQVKKVIQSISRNTSRPDWDEYFMGIARVVALRSNCIKRKVAAVVVKDKRIVSTGYNGTPRGVQNCNEGGCPRCNSFAESGSRLDECLCSHAEENGLTQAAYHGVCIKEAVLYTTFSPCLICTKMIINSGLSEVVYSHEYSVADTALRLLKEAGVVVRKL